MRLLHSSAATDHVSPRRNHIMTDQEIFAAVTRLCESMSIGTAYTKAAEGLGVPRSEILDAYLRIHISKIEADWKRSIYGDDWVSQCSKLERVRPWQANHG